MKKGLVSQETDQSFSITGRNPHEEPSNQPLMNAPHDKPSSLPLTKRDPQQVWLPTNFMQYFLPVSVDLSNDCVIVQWKMKKLEKSSWQSRPSGVLYFMSPMKLIELLK